jgi:hypothetical protein
LKKGVISFLLLLAFSVAAGWVSFRPELRLLSDTEWDVTRLLPRWGARGWALLVGGFAATSLAGLSSLVGRLLPVGLSREGRVLVSFAAALAAFSSAAFGLAVNGILHGPLIALVLAGAFPEGWRVLRGWFKALPDLRRPGIGFLAIPFVLLWLPELLSPPIAWDAVLDHSRFARETARTHVLPPAWPDHTGDMPKLTDLVLAALVSMGGEPLARMGNVLAPVLSFLALASLARGAGDALRISTSILLSCGALLFLSTLGYVEGFLAAFSLASLACLVESLRGGKAANAWFSSSAFLLGCALGVKYTALFTAAGLLLVWLLPPRGSGRPRPSPASLLLFLLPALPWLLRNLLGHGNPFYPLGIGHFGSGTGGYSPALEERLLSDTGAPASWTLSGAAVAIGRAFFTPDNQLGAPITPLMVMALPWAAGAWRDGRFRSLALFASGSIAAWCLFATSLRHAAAPVLVLAALAGWAWSIAFREGGRPVRWAFATGWAVSLWMALAAQLRTDAPWPAALGLESRDSRLARHYHFDRDVFAAYRVIERDAGPGDLVLVHGAFQAYPLRATAFVDFKWKPLRLLQWAGEAGSAEELARQLRRRGLRYILYPREEARRMALVAPAAPAALASAEEVLFWRRHVEPLFAGDNTLVYRLRDRPGPAAAPVLEIPVTSPGERQLQEGLEKGDARALDEHKRRMDIQAKAGFEGSARDWYLRAVGEFTGGDCDRATQAVGRARALGLENARMAVMMAECLARQGRGQEARLEGLLAARRQGLLSEEIRNAMGDD